MSDVHHSLFFFIETLTLRCFLLQQDRFNFECAFSVYLIITKGPFFVYTHTIVKRSFCWQVDRYLIGLKWVSIVLYRVGKVINCPTQIILPTQLNGFTIRCGLQIYCVHYCIYLETKNAFYEKQVKFAFILRYYSDHIFQF